VIIEPGRGYSHHPQLVRFRQASDPDAAIGGYLAAVADEADGRGYRFDRGKIRVTGCQEWLTVSDCQLAYEWGHLLAKLERRSPMVWQRWRSVPVPEPHPLFTVAAGPIAEWEKVDSRHDDSVS
jgi:hypothetical protein